MAAAHARTVRASRLGPLVAIVVAVGLSGCTGSAAGAGTSPAAAPATSAPAVIVTEAEPVTGLGPTPASGAPLTIPDDAQSVSIAFACDGGEHVVVEFGDSMRLEQAVLHGVCDGTRELSWPLTDETEPVLSVTIPDGVAWTATPTYSTAPFVYDDAVTEGCGTFAELYSALMNADSGYTNYDAFGEDEWNDRIDTAVGGLAELAATGAPSLSDPVVDVHALASSPDREVGRILTPDMLAAIGAVSRVCDTNQTPLILTGEFGG
jgi:hypothetical protein